MEERLFFDPAIASLFLLKIVHPVSFGQAHLVGNNFATIRPSAKVRPNL
jgi:hypothetical protein